ncbi:anaerobic ribonucleoside-triphosphate reductase activating protein [bacterium]|nr:anaerobic ribonucleoside-triphosphate reductase activating protein [bacterium]
MPTPELSIGGLSPMSTVDWPGQLVATVFLRGCPWNCSYCHNPHLLGAADEASDGEQPTWTDVLSFLHTRRGLLDGVVFSGGEPTCQSALPAAAAAARVLGFKVGLHSSGPLPDRFEAMIEHADWVGFDVKAPFASYERVTRVPGSGIPARKSLRHLLCSGVDYEVRTTVHSELLKPEDLIDLARDLQAEGVRRWVVQSCRTLGTRPGLPEPIRLDEAALRMLIGEAICEFELRT